MVAELAEATPLVAEEDLLPLWAPAVDGVAAAACPLEPWALWPEDAECEAVDEDEWFEPDWVASAIAAAAAAASASCRKGMSIFIWDVIVSEGEVPTQTLFAVAVHPNHRHGSRFGAEGKRTCLLERGFDLMAVVHGPDRRSAFPRAQGERNQDDQDCQ